jgi:phthiocerol/phenolphthiocerol synthesis type-I polyketide synthase E
VLLEVGPGNTLVSLARQQGGDPPAAVAGLRHPRDGQDDRAFLLGALGRLWLAGVQVDWARVHAGDRRRRVVLPTYPFERQPYWVEKSRDRYDWEWMAGGGSLERRGVADWFYQPSWRRLLPAELHGEPAFPEGGARWLVFLDETGLGARVVDELVAAGQMVATVRAGAAFAATGTLTFTIDPRERADYVALLKALEDARRRPRFVLHLWGLTAGGAGTAPGLLDDRFEGPLEEAEDRGFYSLLFLAQALSRTDVKDALTIAVVTNGMQEVVGGELRCPEKATVLGPCRVIPQEMAHVECRSFDVELPPPASPEETALARRLLAELATGQPDGVVAYRGRHRWIQALEPTPLAPPNGHGLLRRHGVYLVTGGLGGIGLALARHLAERYQARLVLTGRSAVPPAGEWPAWLAAHEAGDATSERIRQLLDLEARGAAVVYVAGDVARREDMEAAVQVARERFGCVQGVVHAAGVAGGGIIPLKEREAAARVMAPKVRGTLALHRALAGEPLDFFVLCSSIAALQGGFGQIDYCAANAFQDAFAHRAAASATRVVAVNWDAWREVGMAVNTPVSGPLQALREVSLKVGIAPGEGVDAFERVLGAGASQLAVFTMDQRPALLRAQMKRRAEAPVVAAAPAAPVAEAARAASGLGSDLERTVAQAWEHILGREGIGVNDNFFELGGDSLTALQVIARLKAHLGREIPVVRFYEAPTVGRLAKALAAEEGEKPAVLEEVEQRAGTRLDLMQRRRQKRGAGPVLDSAR